MGEAKHTLFVCVTCNPNQRPPSADAACVPHDFKEDGLGNRMFQSVTALVAKDPELTDALNVQPIKCMCNCARPCSVAYAGEDKNTLLFADMHPDQHAEDVVAFAKIFINNPIGTTPKDKRPASMRGTLVARIPPYILPRK